MTEDSLDDKISRVKKELQAIVYGSEYEPFDDFIYSENEEEAWKGMEPNFTKRIYTLLPTKRRLRVTYGNKIYMLLLLLVTKCDMR